MLENSNLKKISLYLPLILVSLIFFLSSISKINLMTADLGRHLKNGEMVLKDPRVFFTNYYSYTEPNFVFLNHHWLTGVIFYFIYQVTGFSGLSIFFSLFSLITFFIFLNLAKKSIGQNFACLLSLLLIPLILERQEIRPEIFSYLLAGIFYYLLLVFKAKRISFYWLLILPLLQIFWVNAHIYFFLGIGLTGLFFLDSLLNFRKNGAVFFQLLSIFILTVVASLVNPFFIRGLLMPLTIFNDYGYRLVENQPVWFIEKLVPNPNYLIFKIACFILILSFIISFLIKKRFILINFLLALFLSLIAWISIRNFALFALFCLPLIAFNLKDLVKIHDQLINNFFILIANGIIILVFLFIISGNLSLSPHKSAIGLGLEENNSLAADFFKKEGLSGPIFNDYDIGGYLIFYLFPKERVFVDNRPEAYGKDFFQKIYVPMQENEKVWQKINQQYNFNVIFFNRNDATPWAQQFLINRINDKDWSAVFVDNYSIIFLKRNQKNETVIKAFEIPRNYFTVR